MTCSAASWQSAWKPIVDRSASGSSRCQTISSREIASLSNESSSSVWSAPIAEATRRASASSDRGSSRKPTENVLSGSVMFRAMSAAIKLESRPPREHRAERHIAHQAEPDGFFELREELLRGVLQRHRTRETDAGTSRMLRRGSSRRS